MHIRSLIIAAAWAGSLAAGSQAAVVGIDAGGVNPTDTKITFNKVKNEALVGDAYGSAGVVFSGALLGMTSFGDTRLFPGGGGGVIASNWRYSQAGFDGLSFTADFSAPTSRLGFLLENHPSQNLTVVLFSGAQIVGSFDFGRTSDLTAEFRGLESTDTFTRAVFTNTRDTNGFFAIDDFVFGGAGSTGGAVPEPATWGMILVGFGAVGFTSRRRRTLAKAAMA